MLGMMDSLTLLLKRLTFTHLATDYDCGTKRCSFGTSQHQQLWCFPAQQLRMFKVTAFLFKEIVDTFVFLLC